MLSSRILSTNSLLFCINSFVPHSSSAGIQLKFNLLFIAFFRKSVYAIEKTARAAKGRPHCVSVIAGEPLPPLQMYREELFS